MSHSTDLQHDMHATPRERGKAEPMAPAPHPEVVYAADGAPSESGPADRDEQGIPHAELDAGRIEAIRERYARGTYDTADIVTEVARRMLADGDV